MASQVFAETNEAQKLQRERLRANGTGFLLSMDDGEKTRAEMEQKKNNKRELKQVVTPHPLILKDSKSTYAANRLLEERWAFHLSSTCHAM